MKNRTISWNSEDRHKLEAHLRNRQMLITGTTKRIDYFRFDEAAGRKPLYWAIMEKLYA